MMAWQQWFAGSASVIVSMVTPVVETLASESTVIGRTDSGVTLIDTWGTSQSLPMIQPSQEYYWTPEWQDAEREALAEIQRGESVEFESADDAIRWLDED